MFAKIFQEKYEIVDGLLSFTAIPDDRGRILIPASIRRRLKIRFGSTVIASVGPETKTVKGDIAKD